MGSNPAWRIELQTRQQASANEAEGPGGTLTLPAFESPRVQRCIQFLAAGRQRSPLGKTQLLRLKSSVPEGGNFDELVAVPLDRLAELHR